MYYFPTEHMKAVSGNISINVHYLKKSGEKNENN